MNRSISLRVVCFGLGFTLATAATAQDKETANGRGAKEEVQEYSEGIVRLWMKALLESADEQNSFELLERLSFFHLSAAQVKEFITAADLERSDSKRVVLWHAIRRSHDFRGRDYLIHTLVEKSSPDLQVQFLERLRNPTRFDVPIFAALYNNDRKRKAEPPPAEPNAKEPAPIPILKDVFDVPLKIIELTCHADWKWALVDSSSSSYPIGNNATEELRSKQAALDARARTEAELAQAEMVRWLIKYGFEDIHRINAFRKFLASERSGMSRIVSYDYGQDLLKGLDAPESKAQAVWLVSGSVDPSRFLNANEDEVVRLSAIEGMGRMVYGSLRNQNLTFSDTISTYKPILEQVIASDSSPSVRTAAKRLQETIVEYEKMKVIRKGGADR